MKLLRAFRSPLAIGIGEGDILSLLMLSIHRILQNVYLEDGEMAVIDCINQ
jgi:glucosamine 6-phosphate synthetase-like amidotransferase/phosphosugar isomerase protein